MPKFNELPQFFEELKLKEEITIEELITQFKQQIPINYVEMKLEEGNYCGSTNPKWKNKPLCERYGFDYQNKWVQLDIPHSLLEKLGLNRGEDIIRSFYLAPNLLEKETSYGGITVENEEEIILVNPNKVLIKEQEVQTDLSIKDAEELEKIINLQKEEIEKLQSQQRVNIDKLKEYQSKLNLSWVNFGNWLTIENIKQKYPALTKFFISFFVDRLKDYEGKCYLAIYDKNKSIRENLSNPGSENSVFWCDYNPFLNQTQYQGIDITPNDRKKLFELVQEWVDQSILSKLGN